jgi:hypothetical protein
VKTKPVLEGFAKTMSCGVSNVVANPDWPKVEEVFTVIQLRLYRRADL